MPGGAFELPYDVQRCALGTLLPDRPHSTEDPAMTAEPRAVSETFEFTCGDCGHSWEATFQVMFFTDPTDASGLTTQEYVDEEGKAIRSPLADAICPKCGGRTVRVLEARLAERARRAEHEPRPPHEHHEHQLHLPHRHSGPPEDETR